MEVFETQELWARLKKNDKPLLIYGMGNGADKIISVLNGIGIEPNGFFASDGFVRGNLFHGKRIVSYSEACATYGDFIVLIAFGSSLPDVMGNMKKIASEKETYAPDVPVSGNELFTANFYLENLNKINRARELLADEKSREVFDEMIKFKLDGKISHFSVDSTKEDALKNILSGNYSAYLDLGAYNGDTIKESLEYYPSIKKITAFEPSPRIFKKLSAYCNEISDVSIDLFNGGASRYDGDSEFIDGAGRNSQIANLSNIQAYDSKLANVKIARPDTVCKYKNEQLLIKFDIEGNEMDALSGSIELINNNNCEMIVSLYHRSEDLFALPLYINGIMPSKKLYIRKHPYIPAWDINLYVTN